MAIRQSTLQNFATRYPQHRNGLIQVANENFSGRVKSAFLCHSHKDQELVKGLVVLFQEIGVNLYVDWQDQSMPEKPNKTTAQNIKKRIDQSEYLLFLATQNSISSKWCPWEIGYADSCKTVYVIPTSDWNGTYGSEYLDLYPRIEPGRNTLTEKDEYGVFFPGNDTGSALNSYF